MGENTDTYKEANVESKIGYTELVRLDKLRAARDKRAGIIANIVFNGGLFIFLMWCIGGR